MNGRLLIVDGHAYAYRAFHAIRGMRSPAGEPTGAVFGFIKMLTKAQSNVSSPKSKADRRGAATLDFRLETLGSSLLTVVVWDGGLSAERLAALPEYKAQRPEMPADLASQIDGIVSYLEAAGMASVCQEGVEADDLIACLARRGAEAGWQVVIASSDKDFMQLVSGSQQSAEGKGQRAMGKEQGEEPSALRPSLSAPGRIGLLNPNDKSELVWGAEQVRNKTGVEPSQVVDWLALVGDSVDNIPGVPGVGPKTAAELLRQFGSVEGMYRRLSEVRSERLRGALENSAVAVRRNQELVRLKVDLAWDFTLEEFQEKPADAGRLAELFRRWGFRSLLAEVEAGSSGEPTGRQERQERQAVLL